ncbi:hypothetical protein RSAG8_02992, partial [Rhizoctonia solani AG-8 WAC10335]
MTWAQMWKCNTKDAFFMRAGQYNQYRFSEAEQVQRRVILNRQILYIPINGLRRFFTRLLFRRIHPVERKGYAFARNLFAVLAMGILVFRAITALIQTKSKHDVQVLVLVGSAGGLGDKLRIQTEISIETNEGAIKPCEQTVRNTYGDGWYSYIILSYACNYSTTLDWDFKPYTYLITANSSSQSTLTYEDMPLVWLANKKEIIDNKGELPPFYSTPWRPLPGHHSELEAGLVSRGFISSPIMRDLVLNADPEYTYISLYPIANLAATPLANSTVATARLHLTMKPSLNYLRDREPFNKVNSREQYPLVEAWVDSRTCDFIEDYRTGTILDVLGSVGGLFAILQTIHILLFGRPLLWGLSGTKMINPFGFVGAFDTKDFSRRLHETYGREPTKDNPDPIQTAAFLRDFVIDFGPLTTEASQDRNPTALRPATDRQGTLNSMVPLMPVRRGNTMEYESEHETNINSSPSGAQKTFDTIS